MHERFCLNTATIKIAPLETQIALAREAGFRQIGLWLKDVEAATAQGKSLREIKARLDSSGLRVAEFCFLGGWMDADEARLPEVLNQARRICEVSRELGCETVVTVPALGPGCVSGAAERFRQMCQVAEESGVRIALEFPGIAAEVKDLRSARDLVSAAACPNGGLVIDTFHFFVGGSKLADFDGMAPEQIFLVHLSDAMNLPMERLRIPHDNRTFPGEGTINFTPIFKELARCGYNGALSLEIWNREFHQSDPAWMVKKGRECLQRLEPLLHQNQTAIAEG